MGLPQRVTAARFLEYRDCHGIVTGFSPIVSRLLAATGAAGAINAFLLLIPPPNSPRCANLSHLAPSVVGAIGLPQACSLVPPRQPKSTVLTKRPRASTTTSIGKTAKSRRVVSSSSSDIDESKDSTPPRHREALLLDSHYHENLEKQRVRELEEGKEDNIEEENGEEEWDGIRDDEVEDSNDKGEDTYEDIDTYEDEATITTTNTETNKTTSIKQQLSAIKAHLHLAYQSISSLERSLDAKNYKTSG
ncbi:MAG: hypothetical protein M1816_001647 [Peltula sp. TS41687]|nr:MAG: hypothetical protein M1816_001647 [Peltula sp. TS41687]